MSRLPAAVKPAKRVYHQLWVAGPTQAVIIELRSMKEALATFKELFGVAAEAVWKLAGGEFEIAWGGPQLLRHVRDGECAVVAPHVSVITHTYKVKGHEVSIDSEVEGWTIVVNDEIILSCVVPTQEIAEAMIAPRPEDY